MIERFFRNLAPALNKDPQKVNIIQITSNKPLSCVVNNGMIQIEGLATYDLSAYTISSLTNAINSLSGLTASFLNYGQLSALTLIDGTYQLSGILPIFTNPLWQFGMTIAQQLSVVEQQTNNALFQANPKTASGVWLNALGTQYKVPRIQNEPDSLYGVRVFDFSLASRINNIAIEQILNDLGYKSTVTDTTPGPAFTVTVNLPNNPQGNFVYSTGSLISIINLLKAAGVSANVVLQGDFQDTIHIHDSITVSTPSAAWVVGSSITVGEFIV